jgi:hypothetical protein
MIHKRKRVATMGGNTIKQIHNREFYSSNGVKGGNAIFAKYGKKFYRAKGLKGAAVRKRELDKGKKRKKWESGEEPNNNSSVGSSVV